MTVTSRLQLALSTLQLRLFCVRPFSHLSSDSTLIHSKNQKEKKKITIIYNLKNTTKCLFTGKIKKLLLNFRVQKKKSKIKTASWFPKLSKNQRQFEKAKKKVKINNPNFQKIKLIITLYFSVKTIIVKN